MNKERLLQLARHVRGLEHTTKTAQDVDYYQADEMEDHVGNLLEQFNMSDYFMTYIDDPNCGTAGCLAGHTVGLFDDGKNHSSEFVRDIAGELLGLTDSESFALFIPNGFQVGSLSYNDLTPEMAADAIENFVKTGDPEDAWQRAVEEQNA